MMLKPAPDIAAALTVTADVPLEVNVNPRVEYKFTVVSPKSSVAALTVSCELVAATPVPPSATTVVLPLLESLLIVSCPVADPVTVGLNCTFSVSD